MKLRPGAFIVFAIPAAVAAGAVEALAQPPQSPRAPNGMFYRSETDTNTGHKLGVTLFSTEGYDRDVAPDPSPVANRPGLEPTGYSTMLAGAADYGWVSRRVQIRATGQSTLRLYGPLGDVGDASGRSASHSAGAGFFVRSTKTTVALSQTVLRSSSPLYNLFPRSDAVTPGDAPPTAPDYAMNDSETHSYESAMTLTREVTRRSRLSASVDWQHMDSFGGLSGRRGLDVYGTRGEVSHRLARNTTAAVGYVYRIGNSDSGTAVPIGRTSTERGIEISVDHRSPLSATRSVTLGVRLGGSTMMLPESADGSEQADQRSDRLSGQLTFGYEFGRTWQARAIYRRGVDYVAGIGEPVGTNSFTTSVDGLLTRRLDARISAAYARGESALIGHNASFETYTAGVTLRYALTRMLASYVEGLYYLYDARGTIPLAPQIPSAFERTGARAGLTLRVPALR